MPKELSEQEKRYLRLGCASIKRAWYSAGGLLLVPVVGALGAKLPHDIAGPGLLIYGVLTVGCLLISAGMWIWATYKVKCPECGWLLLRNPKGMGNPSFKLKTDAPKVKGVNTWTYQVLRGKREGRIMCICCGTDFDISPLSSSQQQSP